MSESLKVQWSDALNTGNRAIDNQHKYLVDIINDLAGAIETGQTAQSLKKIVNLLQYYTEWHFCKEEGCMDKLKCPAAARNKQAHAQFIETFLGFRRELESGGDSNEIATRMYKTLVAWLVQHIQGIDSQLGLVSGEGGQAVTPAATVAEPVPVAEPEPEPEPVATPVAASEPVVTAQEAAHPPAVEVPAPAPAFAPEPPKPEAPDNKTPAKKWWHFGR